MNNVRQQKILETIEKHEIYTQEGLLEVLKQEGFNVTQATVSRDIKKLNLIKALTTDGKYKYICHKKDEKVSESIKFKSVFIEAVMTVDYAMNTVVLKCHTGMANAACASLDHMNLPNVVGTIAGDDTIFVLLRTEQNAKDLVVELNKFLRE